MAFLLFWTFIVLVPLTAADFAPPLQAANAVTFEFAGHTYPAYQEVQHSTDVGRWWYRPPIHIQRENMRIRRRVLGDPYLQVTVWFDHPGARRAACAAINQGRNVTCAQVNVASIPQICFALSLPRSLRGFIWLDEACFPTAGAPNVTLDFHFRDPSFLDMGSKTIYTELEDIRLEYSYSFDNIWQTASIHAMLRSRDESTKKNDASLKTASSGGVWLYHRSYLPQLLRSQFLHVTEAGLSTADLSDREWDLLIDGLSPQGSVTKKFSEMTDAEKQHIADAMNFTNGTKLRHITLNDFSHDYKLRENSFGSAAQGGTKLGWGKFSFGKSSGSSSSSHSLDVVDLTSEQILKADYEPGYGAYVLVDMHVTYYDLVKILDEASYAFWKIQQTKLAHNLTIHGQILLGGVFTEDAEHEHHLDIIRELQGQVVQLESQIKQLESQIKPLENRVDQLENNFVPTTWHKIPTTVLSFSPDAKNPSQLVAALPPSIPENAKGIVVFFWVAAGNARDGSGTHTLVVHHSGTFTESYLLDYTSADANDWAFNSQTFFLHYPEDRSLFFVPGCRFSPNHGYQIQLRGYW